MQTDCCLLFQVQMCVDTVKLWANIHFAEKQELKGVAYQQYKNDNTNKGAEVFCNCHLEISTTTKHHAPC